MDCFESVVKALGELGYESPFKNGPDFEQTKEREFWEELGHRLSEVEVRKKLLSKNDKWSGRVSDSVKAITGHAEKLLELLDDPAPMGFHDEMQRIYFKYDVRQKLLPLGTLEFDKLQWSLRFFLDAAKNHTPEAKNVFLRWEQEVLCVLKGLFEAVSGEKARDSIGGRQGDTSAFVVFVEAFSEALGRDSFNPALTYIYNKAVDNNAEPVTDPGLCLWLMYRKYSIENSC